MGTQGQPRSSYQERPDNGSLWQRDKKTDKSPDYGGKIRLSEELLKGLLNRIQSNEPPYIDIGIWMRRNSRGEPYMGAQVRLYNPRVQQAAPPPAWVETPSGPSETRNTFETFNQELPKRPW